MSEEEKDQVLRYLHELAAHIDRRFDEARHYLVRVEAKAEGMEALTGMALAEIIAFSKRLGLVEQLDEKLKALEKQMTAIELREAMTPKPDEPSW